MPAPGRDNPFVSHAFLGAMEDSGSAGPRTGWLPQHAVLRTGAGEVVAAAPMYAKSHSYGEYVFDHGWAHAFERARGKYYPKLQVSVPFSPVPGPRLLVRPGAAPAWTALAGALVQACGELDLSSVHATFCTEAEWERLGEAGWLRRLGMQFHWDNPGYGSFDDFLGALSSRKRKVLRRERRDANAAGLTFRALRGGEIGKREWDAFYRFYSSTVDRKWGSAYLTRQLFAAAGRAAGRRGGADGGGEQRRAGRRRAQSAGRDTLYGRNWGCRGDWPFLHFELCYYRAIDWAIEHGLKRVEAGAQGRAQDPARLPASPDLLGALDRASRPAPRGRQLPRRGAPGDPGRHGGIGGKVAVPARRRHRLSRAPENVPGNVNVTATRPASSPM